MVHAAFPPAQGLYDPRHERDACGVAFVATLTGVPSHAIVASALTALENLEHRGASGSEPDSGDGAGILTQIPDAFFRAIVPFDLPPAGEYAAGTAFLPQDPDLAAQTVARIEEIALDEGLRVLGWRDLPVDPSLVGHTARSVMPVFRQLFVSAPGRSGMDLERVVFCLRKRAEREADVYFPSLSCRTIAYKGMLTTAQLGHRSGPLPVLDEHVPVLAVGAPVSADRPQRRDQHRDGQPQLDAGARGHAHLAADPRRHDPPVPDLHPRRQ